MNFLVHNQNPKLGRKGNINFKYLHTGILTPSTSPVVYAAYITMRISSILLAMKTDVSLEIPC